MRDIFLKGQKVGNCIFDSEQEKADRANRLLRTCWFICKCGNKFLCRPSLIKLGVAKGCGCFETGGMKSKKHGLNTNNTPTPECRAWYNMRERCLSKKSKLYKYYGGNGIKICDRWLGENGLKNFIADMGLRPSSSHSLDRFPNKTRDYSPENCRWATKKEQSSNTSRNIYLTYNGETKTLTEWAEFLGLLPVTIIGRHRRGWAIEDILRSSKWNHTKKFTRIKKEKRCLTNLGLTP